VVEQGCTVVDRRLEDTIVMANATIRDSRLQRSLVGERTTVQGITGSIRISDDSQVMG